MYKVLLVDDEPWALVSTRNSFEWENYGFEVSMETSNPYDAIEILCSQKIHAAFVDIRMPGISGLELVKAIKAKEIDTEFIITSGYAEFSYAQEAIHEGVFEYCLKPIQPDITGPLLERLATHLESRQADRDMELYDRLVKERRDISEVLGAERFNAAYPCFQVLDIRSSGELTNKPMSRLPDHSSILSLRLGRHRTIHIINKEGNTDPGLMEETANAGTSGFHIGISSVSGDAASLAGLIREAEIAANKYFVIKDAEVCRYGVPNLALVNDYVDKLFRNFDSYTVDDLNQTLNRIPGRFADNGLGFEEAYCFWNQTTAELLKLNIDPALVRELELHGPEDLAFRFGGMEDMCRYLADLLSDIKKKDSAQADISNVNDSFLKLLDHVRKSYASQLYLKELANDFHINFTYCCDLFKKVTLMTFSQFLTDIRMGKAREFLEETGIPVEEIGYSVGFQDYHYFFSVFKKNTGMTPSQYRREKRSEYKTGV